MLDFVDAFFRVPLNPGERHFYVVHYAVRSLQWNRVAQGSTNGPQAFGRLAALVGRLTQSAMNDSQARLHIYTDDPVMVMRGAREQTNKMVAKAVLLWRCMGLQLAFHKGAARQGGHVGRS